MFTYPESYSPNGINVSRGCQKKNGFIQKSSSRECTGVLLLLQLVGFYTVTKALGKSLT